MTETADLVTWGEIQGRTITFPMHVASMDAATIGFTVPADAAARLLPGDAFEIVETGPGTAQFILAVCDYLENPWGDYLEINLGFLARPAGAPPEVIGSFVYRMPVDQDFTCEAGNKVMGFPKTVEDLRVVRSEGRITFAWHDADGLILSVGFPMAPATGDSPQVEAVSYSYLDGRAYATPLSMGMGTGMIDPADIELEVGQGVVAEELRSLGLPRPADFATWGEGLSATFQLGTPIT